MTLVLFSKIVGSKTIDDLIAFARATKIDGYDLAVRKGFCVEPHTASQTLPTAVRTLRAAGLSVPMITGEFRFTPANDPSIEPLFKTMDALDIRVFKIGCFSFDLIRDDYIQAVQQARDSIREYLPLSDKYNIRLAYQTHSGNWLGANASGLAHLFDGLSERNAAFYLDTAHLSVCGEPFNYAARVAGGRLGVVGLKDYRYRISKSAVAGGSRWTGVPAGEGDVDWRNVADAFKQIDHPVIKTIHIEFPFDDLTAVVAREVEFYRSIFAD
ncbi:MAG: TIM barrel protein [Planctomycetota bacterium]